MKIIFTEFPIKFISGAGMAGRNGPMLVCEFNDLSEFYDAIQEVSHEIEKNWPKMINAFNDALSTE